ncbi:hypothetical protein [Streptomyces sp. Inha503]|uniref:hypothetical protein n=1 Tax=Streptomyces sp. Inha503 TaxID=3383314 RepID=UPI0039A39F26
MRGNPSARQAASAAFAVAAVLLLAGCGTDDTHPKAASPEPSTTTTSAGTSPPPTTKPPTTPAATPSAPPTDHRLPAHVPSDASDQAKEDLLGLRALELQSALRDIDPALGAAEDINKAGEQCYDLRRKAANPDEKAARRFSTPHHKVTVSNGKRINALLRGDYCS